MQYEKTTGQLMKERRKQLGMSAEYVAGRIGVSPSTVYRYENGEIDKLPLSNLVPIAKVLCTTPVYLMGWDDNPEPAPLFLDPEEDTLLEWYRDMNESGKAALLTMAKGLHESNAYKK